MGSGRQEQHLDHIRFFRDEIGLTLAEIQTRLRTILLWNNDCELGLVLPLT
jgi:hypothetical protein